MTGTVLCSSIGATFFLGATLLAACGSDQDRGGGAESCSEDDDCSSGRCEEGECVPSDGSASSGSGGTGSDAGPSGGMPGSTSSGMDASTSSSTSSTGMESGSTGSSMGHLPQCVAYADHVCGLCYANGQCPAEWYESVASDCDSSYRICPALYTCATSAASCEAATDCHC